MPDPGETIQHRWFREVWNEGRTEAIDELVAPNVLGHGLIDADGNDVRGIEAFKSFYYRFREAFPDIHVTVEDTVAEGNKIVARCSVAATYLGDGLEVRASGKPVRFTGMCMVRVEDGRIVESWNSFDFLTMLQQIGLVNLPGPH
jgi:steroid delta-isomerase-like uncharacterized protein